MMRYRLVWILCLLSLAARVAGAAEAAPAAAAAKPSLDAAAQAALLEEPVIPAVPNPADAPNAQKLQTQLDFLYDATHNDPSKISLIGHDNEFYIDLQRELERFQRTRQNRDELKQLHDEVTARLTELKQLQAALTVKVKEETEHSENLQYLVTLYESIAPDKVATLLKKLPYNVTLHILKKMNPSKTSKVLASMDEKFAGEISRRMVRSEKKIAKKENSL